MPTRKFEPDAPYQSLRGACRITGLSVGFLREGCKTGVIPHIMCGKEFRVNVPLLLKQLEEESSANAGGRHEV